jgi:hypothetical protein
MLVISPSVLCVIAISGDKIKNLVLNRAARGILFQKILFLNVTGVSVRPKSK